jgi:glycosyltransferase involved in cell wall biosynthesis
MTDRLLCVSPDLPSSVGGGSVVADRLRSDLGVESIHVRPHASPTSPKLLGRAVMGGTIWESYLPPMPGSLRRVARLMDQGSFTVLHAHGFGHPVVDAVVKIGLRRVPRSVVTVHGLPNLKARARLLRIPVMSYLRYATRVLREVDAVTCPSDEVRDELSRLFDIDAEVVPWGVDGSIEWRPPRTSFPKIIAVGRVIPLKRYELLVEAFARVQRRWPAARLLIAGAVADMAYARAVARLAVEMGVGDAIEWVGHLDRAALSDGIASSHLYVSFSKQESFGLATLEAAASGIPMLVTDVGVARDLSKLGGIVLLQREGAGDMAASAVLEALDGVEELAESARTRAGLVRARYRWDTTVDRYREILGFGARIAGRSLQPLAT